MQDLIHAYLDHALASAVGFLSNKFDALQKVNLPLLWVVAPLSTVIAVLSCGDIPFRTQVGLRCDLKEGPSMIMPRSLHFLHTDSTRPTMIRHRHHSARQFVHWLLNPMMVYTRQVSDSVDRNVISMNGTTPFLPSLIWAYPLGRQATWITPQATRVAPSPLVHIQSVHIIGSLSLAFWRKISRQLQDLWYLKLSKK